MFCWLIFPAFSWMMVAMVCFLLGVIGAKKVQLFLVENHQNFGKRKFENMKNAKEKHDHPDKWMNVCIRPCIFSRKLSLSWIHLGLFQKKTPKTHLKFVKFRKEPMECLSFFSYPRWLKNRDDDTFGHHLWIWYMEHGGYRPENQHPLPRYFRRCFSNPNVG